MEIEFPKFTIPKQIVQRRGHFEIHSCFKTTFDEVGKIKSERIQEKA